MTLRCGLVVFFSLAACGPVDGKNSCVSMSDCLAGYSCVNQLCVSGAGGGTAGGGSSSLTDGGNLGTLTGPEAFSIGTAVVGAISRDGGSSIDQMNIIMISRQISHPSGNICMATSGNGPLQGFQASLYKTDGSPMTVGRHLLTETGAGGTATIDSFDARNSRVSTVRILRATFDIARLDTRSVGTFTGDVALPDGGTNPIGGSWDTPVCGR